MNNKGIPICPVCGKLINKEELSSNRPVEIYNNCLNCKVYEGIIDIAPISTILLMIVFSIVYLFKPWNIQYFISQIGLLFNIAGVVLLLGNLGRIFSAISVWKKDDIINKELPKHTKKTKIGLFFVVTGSVIQLIAYFL